MQKLCNFINGELVPPVSGKYIDNINPATQEIINAIPDSDYRDVETAINAAQVAYKKWGKLHFKERAVYLDKIAEVMKEDKTFQQLARADSIDMGKPISLMRQMDVPAAIDEFEKYSKLIQCATTPYYQMSDAVGIEHRNPIGIVGLISPWNFPILLICIKVSVAIVCGNCVICKPSELTPTSSYLLCKIFKQVGLPPGVVNVVHGYGMKAGEPITSAHAVRAISFTGGSVTGSRISSIAAPKLKKLQLELGGKNAAIVFNDCYLDETVQGIAVSEFLNTGQVCCSGSRLLIQKGISDRFIEKLKQHVNDVYIPAIGDPLSEKTMMGPLVSTTHFKKVKKYLDLAIQEGGSIICGGKYGRDIGNKLSSSLMNGNWFEPTIVVGLDDKCRCAMEEIFGPILTVHTFETEEEAIAIANQVDYGLAASVWTSDIRRGQRVARELEAGSVWINCYLYGDNRMPFGGFKNSGVQREGGKHSIDFFTEIKSIVSKL
jgi:aminomuconate-semialdehyde/2-hydroxymuconate-6-semialdehyde dehydrogenase